RRACAPCRRSCSDRRFDRGAPSAPPRTVSGIGSPGPRYRKTARCATQYRSAMAQRDHYEILGVTRSSTQEEIKIAFRKLASQHHPAKNPGDAEAVVRFKEVNASYQVLSAPNRRAMYDRFGHRAEDASSPFGQNGPFAGGVIDINDIAIDGILGDILG